MRTTHNYNYAMENRVIKRYCLEAKIPGEPMKLKIKCEINRKLNFLYGKKRFLTTKLRQLLRNALSAHSKMKNEKQDHAKHIYMILFEGRD